MITSRAPQEQTFLGYIVTLSYYAHDNFKIACSPDYLNFYTIEINWKLITGEFRLNKFHLTLYNKQLLKYTPQEQTGNAPVHLSISSARTSSSKENACLQVSGQPYPPRNVRLFIFRSLHFATQFPSQFGSPLVRYDKTLSIKRKTSLLTQQHST